MRFGSIEHFHNMSYGAFMIIWISLMPRYRHYRIMIMNGSFLCVAMQVLVAWSGCCLFSSLFFACCVCALFIFIIYKTNQRERERERERRLVVGITVLDFTDWRFGCSVPMYNILVLWLKWVLLLLLVMMVWFFFLSCSVGPFASETAFQSFWYDLSIIQTIKYIAYISQWKRTPLK